MSADSNQDERDPRVGEGAPGRRKVASVQFTQGLTDTESLLSGERRGDISRVE
jgi:hypothetical protein